MNKLYQQKLSWQYEGSHVFVSNYGFRKENKYIQRLLPCITLVSYFNNFRSFVFQCEIPIGSFLRFVKTKRKLRLFRAYSMVWRWMWNLSHERNMFLIFSRLRSTIENMKESFSRVQWIQYSTSNTLHLLFAKHDVMSQ